MRFGKICAAAVMAVGLAGVARADTLLDQIGVNGAGMNGIPMASQRFESQYANFDTGVVDDFTVAGGRYHLDTVSAGMGFFNGDGTATFGSVQSYSVEIYSGVGAAGSNLTGDVASKTIAGGAASVQGAVVTLDLSAAGIVLDPGTYFLAVIPRMDVVDNGQIGVSESTIGSPDAFQANPGGGFGFSQGIMFADGVSAAYRLEASPVGAAVPLPASAWGGAALLGILGAKRMKRVAATA